MTLRYATYGVLVALAVLFSAALTFASAIQVREPSQVNSYEYYQFFASSTSATVATTTSATSTNISSYFDADGRLVNGALDVKGAEKVTLYFSRGDTTGQGNTGASVFKIEVTPDGTNWYAFNKLVGSDISSTATSTVTITAATSTVSASMNLTNDTFKAIRCIVIETTDGEHGCAASVEY